MMGISHATSGAAAWIAVTAAVPLATGWYPLDPVGVLVGSFVCAGAALLPDADHHAGTIANSVPVLGRLAARTVGTITGGHRHGAHSPVAIAVAVVLALLLGLVVVPSPQFGAIAVGPAIGTAALVAFGVKARGMLAGWPGAWLAGILVGSVVMLLAPGQFAWFPIAVGLGYAVHLAGDFLTTGGLPGLLWPWVPKPPHAWREVPVLRDLWMPNGYVALPLLGDTGSRREHLLAWALGAYGVVGAVAVLAPVAVPAVTAFLAALTG